MTQPFLKTGQVITRTASKSCFCGVSKSASYKALQSSNCTKQRKSLSTAWKILPWHH